MSIDGVAGTLEETKNIDRRDRTESDDPQDGLLRRLGRAARNGVRKVANALSSPRSISDPVSRSKKFFSSLPKSVVDSGKSVEGIVKRLTLSKREERKINLERTKTRIEEIKRQNTSIQAEPDKSKEKETALAFLLLDFELKLKQVAFQAADKLESQTARAKSEIDKTDSERIQDKLISERRGLALPLRDLGSQMATALGVFANKIALEIGFAAEEILKNGGNLPISIKIELLAQFIEGLDGSDYLNAIDKAADEFLSCLDIFEEEFDRQLKKFEHLDLASSSQSKELHKQRIAQFKREIRRSAQEFRKLLLEIAKESKVQIDQVISLLLEKVATLSDGKAVEKEIKQDLDRLLEEHLFTAIDRVNDFAKKFLTQLDKKSQELSSLFVLDKDKTKRVEEDVITYTHPDTGETEEVSVKALLETANLPKKAQASEERASLKTQTSGKPVGLNSNTRELTKVGNAVKKHSDRDGSTFTKPSTPRGLRRKNQKEESNNEQLRPVARMNLAGKEQLESIFKHPNKEIKCSKYQGEPSLDILTPEFRGARFVKRSETFEFIGFLEPASNRNAFTRNQAWKLVESSANQGQERLSSIGSPRQYPGPSSRARPVVQDEDDEKRPD